MLWALLGRRRPPRRGVDCLLALESEAQRLRLELASRDELVERLRSDLARERAQAQAQLAASVRADRERLLAGIATPITHLVTQAYLLDQGSGAVRAADAVRVGQRLVRALEDEGLGLTGRVGEQVAFDPDWHESLAGDWQPAPGEPVVVRFVGVACRGVLLRRAGVEAVAS